MANESVDPRLELERAEADLAAFSYVLSHDFRSPLRSMEAMARIMLDDHASTLSPDAQAFLKHVGNTAEKLSERANALLRFTKTSRQPLAHHNIDVAMIAREVTAELRKDVPTRHVEVRIGELPSVMGDPVLIRQVFMSLLSNAFKFTRSADPARIDIKGRPDGEQNAYTISDNGAGFDMKYAGKLFGLFQRMHGESEFEGIGIDLAVAKRIVERHGGGMWAEATKGQGATFQFTLPAAVNRA